MGSLGKKLRRKKYNKRKKKILKEFGKLSRKEQRKQYDLVARTLSMLDHRIERGARAPSKKAMEGKPANPDDVIDLIDSLTEEGSDEKDREGDDD